MVFPHVIFVVNFSCGSFNNVMLLFNIFCTVAGYYSKPDIKIEVIIKISKTRLLLCKYLKN